MGKLNGKPNRQSIRAIGLCPYLDLKFGTGAYEHYTRVVKAGVTDSAIARDFAVSRQAVALWRTIFLEELFNETVES